MKKVLIITSTIDYTVDYMIDRYREQCKFYRINVDRFNEYKFMLDNENWTIKSNIWSISIDEIYSIYYRKPGLPDLNDYRPEYHTMIFKDIISLINGIVDSFNGIVLTKPCILRKVENKIYQAHVANQIKFVIPKTIFTNKKEDANYFLYENRSVIKPISVGKIIYNDNVEIYQTNIINELIDEDIDNTPIYMQEYVDKEYEVRLTIINGQIYPVKIMPYNIIDWRIESEYNRYELIDIPEDIKDKCLEMMKIMDINFGAFDFIVNKENEYVFLEVNPNGQWLWLEDELGINISKSIIKYLIGERD